MKIASRIVLAVLVLLAISSGIAKILLTDQEVAFFGKFGFTNPILLTFGLAQLAGGLFMIFAKTRFAGAAVVAITFLASLALLLLDGNIPISIVTGIAVSLLAFIMKQSWRPKVA